VLVDPSTSWVPAQSRLRSKSHNTPFLERELQGRVLATLAGGQLAYQSEALGGRS